MLGIKENNEPVDIKFLIGALRDAIHKQPEKEKYYKITFKDIYKEIMKENVLENIENVAVKHVQKYEARHRQIAVDSFIVGAHWAIDNLSSSENGHLSFGDIIEALKDGKACRRSGWSGKGLFVVKQVPSHITGDIIPNMQSLPQSAKDILMKRENPHIDYTNQMLIINPDGRADSWVPSVSDVFAEDWEVVTE